MRKIVALLGLSLVCCVARARAEDPALPAPVASALAELAKACSDAGGKPSTAAAVRRTDLNRDSRADFVLDVGSIQCKGAGGIFGERDKPVQVFLDDGAGGAELAYSGSAHAVKLEGEGPAARVWLTLTGEGCGKQKARFFSDETYCDRPLAWTEKSKKVELAPVSAAKPVR
jgi:hypothetical protein